MVKLLVALCLALTACSAAVGTSEGVDATASVYPLAFVVREVGGDLVSVTDLTPPDAEPHDLELTPGQARSIIAADLVVYIGEDFQPAVEELTADTEGTKLDALAVVETLDPAGDGDEVGEHADPHFWLDPARMIDLTEAVANELGEIDPEHASGYSARVQRFIAELERLDNEFQQGLDDCKRRSFVTSHEAFAYPADRYDLQQVGIAGVDPEAEPSPQRITDVSQFAKEHGVTTIFFETLVSPRVAETLAEEIGVSTAVLNPLESAPQEGNYFTAMRANLRALQGALDCR
jgi:zinc transport system substrate-binding protein